MRLVKYFTGLLSLWLIVGLVSCSSDVPTYAFTAKVTVLLVNRSNNPSFIWVGHNPLPMGKEVESGNHQDTVLTMKITVYDVTDQDEDNTTYQEDRLDYRLQINTVGQNDTVPKTMDVNIHEVYNKLYRLKFYWDGRTITYKYGL